MRPRAYLVDGVLYGKGMRPLPIYLAKPRIGKLGENCTFVSPSDGKEFEIIVREKLPAGLEPSSDVVPTDPLAIPGDDEFDALTPEGEPEVGGLEADELEPPASEMPEEEEEEEEAGKSEKEKEEEDAEAEEEEEEPTEAFLTALRTVQEGGDPATALANYAECGGGLTIVIQPGGSSGGELPMGDELELGDEFDEIPAMGDASVEDTMGDEYPEEEMEALL